MRTLKITLAYEGTEYVGWQRQDNGLAVQQVVEDALRPFVADAAAVLPVMGASRTDAGVHAAGQVASVRVPFAVPVDAIERAMNIRLPPDIRVLAVADAPPSFHARFDSQGKAYRYRISTARVLSPFERRWSWHLPYRFDLAAMRDAAARLVGTHDFEAFQARGASIADTVRTLTRVDVLASGHALDIVVEGNGFLRHMVRILVGTLVDVGAGRQRPEWVADVIGARDRQHAGATAPAQGLVLEWVRYGDGEDGANVAVTPPHL
jgi:tRNA pseudouridine38-40 synthase